MIKKILSNTLTNIFHYFNISLFVLCTLFISPFLYLFNSVFIQGKRKYSEYILITGIMRLWSGVTSIADGLNKQISLKTVFYYQELKEFYTLNINNSHIVKFSPRIYLMIILDIILLVNKYKIKHVEIYHHINPLILLVQSILLFSLKIPIVTVFTGGEILYWHKHTFIKKMSVKFIAYFAKAIIYKEPYMPEIIKKYNICLENKLHFVHNAIIIKDTPNYEKNGIEILFLNTFKEWRNLDLVIDAAQIVLQKHQEVKFKIVGKIGRANEKELEKKVEDLELYNSVQLLPFTKDSDEYYASASIFLLPADHVYLNNSLLEAMERGIAPIIADAEGSSEIVNDGVSGIIVKKEVSSLAAAISKLIIDSELRKSMGESARKRIFEKFNEKKRSEKLFSIYQKNVWN